MSSDEVSNTNNYPITTKESSLGSIVSGVSDPIGMKIYDVYQQLDPEVQAIWASPPEDRKDVANNLLVNAHRRRTVGGVLGVASGALSIGGGAYLSTVAVTAVSTGISASLAIGGFVLAAFGLQVILGKRPSGKEAQQLAKAITPQKNTPETI